MTPQALAARLRDRPILVLGRAGMDLYADPPGTPIEEAERFTAALGGSAANIAVALARQGLAAGLIGAVADDAVGRFCRRALDRYGVGHAHLRAAGGLARNALAVVDTRGAATQAVIYRNGAADLALEAEAVRGIDWAAQGALIVTGTALSGDPSRTATLEALDLAGRAGCARVLDVDWRPTGWPSAAEARTVCARAAALCEVVIGNDEEFALLAGGAEGALDAARALARGRIVVFKKGAEGAIVLHEGAEHAVPPLPVEALKPTGAGDAFMGGFLAGLAGGAPPEAAARRGAATAALVVTRVGCAPAMPTGAEVEALLADRPH